MSDYDHLLGLEYIEGKQDCFSILRQYCRETYDLIVPNFARPFRFWEDPRIDLYGMYRDQGFVQIMDRPLERGDILLMPIRTAMNSHAAMVVSDNLILHHLPGRLSSVDPVRPRWMALTNVVIRHPDITAKNKTTGPEINYREVVNVRVLENIKNKV